MKTTIEMAREAHVVPYIVRPEHDEYIGRLERLVELARADERSACLDVIESHRIPVGNSAAGEMACEWTYEALKEIKAAIQERGST